jgi:hypothetical protein
MTSIQTTGSHDTTDDEFSFTMCFGDSPTLTFEGLTRDQVRDMRDCLDAMLWHEQDSDYEKTLNEIRKTIGSYVSVRDEEIAAIETISRIRDLLLSKVTFNGWEDVNGNLYWPDVESMLTRPLDY